MTSLLGLLLMTFSSLPLQAETTSSSYTPLETVTVPLNILLPPGRDTTLRGQWDKISFPLTILDTQKAQEIKLSLTMTHSGKIDIANLWVSLGQKALANIQLQPDGNPQQVVISLTPDLLNRYGNTLTVAVRHQLPGSLSLTEQRVNAAEAVTELLANQSFFEFSYYPTQTSPTLESAAALISSGQMHDQPVQLISLLPDNAQGDLTIAGLLVQGWTLRSGSSDYQYHFYTRNNEHSDFSHKSKIQLIYGLPDALAKHASLPQNYLDAINGPYMALHYHQKQWRIIVSGRNEQELLESSKLFANPAFHLPNQTYGMIAAQSTNDQPQVASDTEYPVNLFTQQQRFGDEPLTIPLMMPANFLVNKEEQSHINLVLTHPKVAPGEAAMVIRVNGDYANSMPLRASYWRNMQHYRLSFPMSMLRPGLNNISIELYGPEQQTVSSQTGNITPFIAHISDSSAVQFGAWVNYLTRYEQQLPADQLLFITENNGSDAQVTLNYAQNSDFGDVWQLLSHLAFQARQPMTELLVTDSTTQLRPFNLNFNVGTSGDTLSPAPSDTNSLLNRLRNNLLSDMAESTTGEPINSQSQFFQYPGQSTQWEQAGNSFATLTTLSNGWRNISFTTANEQALTQEMAIYLSQPSSAVTGTIELTVPSRATDRQLLRAGFIAHPLSMPFLLFTLLLALAWFMFRGLEKKS
ncbi:hypothetical protein [Photobacterium aquae]|nr:hypothetical protein [Photobacterium aquae]